MEIIHIPSTLDTDSISERFQPQTECRRDAMPIDLSNYPTEGLFDEMLVRPNRARSYSKHLVKHLRRMDEAELAERQDAADLAIKEMGVTFTVYTEAGAIDRNWPFDIVPRIITADEWTVLEAGLKQRIAHLGWTVWFAGLGTIIARGEQ